MRAQETAALARHCPPLEPRFNRTYLFPILPLPLHVLQLIVKWYVIIGCQNVSWSVCTRACVRSFVRACARTYVRASVTLLPSYHHA